MAIAVAGRYVVLDRATDAPVGVYPIHHTDAQWRALLSPAGFQVLRRRGTETPFSSPLLTEHQRGVFMCAGCGQRLFESATKYDSHTGWPSFWSAIPNTLAKRDDRSLAVSRTEEHCTNCGSHIGHVFDDGPKPTGLRYCMNGAAMTFQPARVWPRHGRTGTMSELFNGIMRGVNSLLGLAMVAMGGIWILQGFDLAFRVGFMVGHKQWALYGALLAFVGAAQIIWSNTREQYYRRK